MSLKKEFEPSRGFISYSMPTGFPSLDENGVKWTSGDLTVVAARPCVGKTAFALSSALKIASEHFINVLFFSLELSTEQISQRIELMSGGDENKLQKFRNGPILIDNTHALPVDECEMRIQQFKAFHKNPVVFIDYLQLMRGPEGYKKNRLEELGYITRRLKQIAKENDVPIVALVQMCRSYDSKANCFSSINDIQYSTEIVPHADSLIILSDEEPREPFITSNRKRVSIVKSPRRITKAFYVTIGQDLIISETIDKEVFSTETPEEITYATNLDENITRENYWIGKQNRDSDCLYLHSLYLPNRQPLLIYGKTGAGKTMLLHYVGNKIKEFRQRVLYVYSGNFREQYIEAKNDTRHLFDFIKFYSKPECLLFDDLDEVSTPGLQDAFQLILKNRVEKNRDTILSSSKTLGELKPSMNYKLYSIISSSEVIILPEPDEADRKEFVRWYLKKNNAQLDEMSFQNLIRTKLSIGELKGLIDSFHYTQKTHKVRLEEVERLIAFYTE